MDDIPYDFLNKVFSLFDHNQFKVEPRFESPLWNDAFRLHKTKTRSLCIRLFSTPQGLQWLCESEGYEQQQGQAGVKHHSFSNALQLDSRFTRVCMFQLVANPEDVGASLPTTRIDALSEVYELSSRFWMRNLYISQIHDLAVVKRLAEEFIKHEFSTANFEVAYAPAWVEPVRKQLKTKELQQVTLYGMWPSDLKADLLAFVCRPNFCSLQTEYACFTPDDIMTVIAYWKTLENPWNDSTIKVGMDRDFKVDFAARMTKTNEIVFEERFGDFLVTVLCLFNVQCMVTFGPYKNAEI